MDNYFKNLSDINVSEKIEKKNNLSYLSWAFCWAEVKKIHPFTAYTVYENAQGWNYHTDGKTCWVKTGVTIEGLEHIEYLPVMDNRNASIPADKVTSFDVNKAIQRSLTKACARHSLGLYIYAGEDLPEGEEPQKPATSKPVATPASPKKDPREIELEAILKPYNRSIKTAQNAVANWYAGETLQTINNTQFEDFKVKLAAACKEKAEGKPNG